MVNFSLYDYFKNVSKLNSIKMFKSIYLVLFTIVSSELIYMKKDTKLGEDICYYKDPETNFEYVRACEEGKYCKGLTPSAGSSAFTCQKVPSLATLKTQGDSCIASIECAGGLSCINEKCSSGCTNTQIQIRKSDGEWDCRSAYHPEYTSYNDDNDATKTITNENPGYLKVKGEIEFKKDSNNLYSSISTKSDYIGTVPKGKFVEDEMACETGFALNFYPDGNLKDPALGGYYNSRTYKKCVEVNSVDSENCVITYDGDNIYKVSSSVCREDLLVKLEMFKRYKDRLSEIRSECEKKENFNEPETCNDDKLRKWWHFYSNPNDYILYYDDEEKDNRIAKFLIQLEYHSFQFSQFLGIKYLITFIFLFLFL